MNLNNFSNSLTQGGHHCVLLDTFDNWPQRSLVKISTGGFQIANNTINLHCELVQIPFAPSGTGKEGYAPIGSRARIPIEKLGTIFKQEQVEVYSTLLRTASNSKLSKSFELSSCIRSILIPDPVKTDLEKVVENLNGPSKDRKHFNKTKHSGVNMIPALVFSKYLQSVLGLQKGDTIGFFLDPSRKQLYLGLYPKKVTGVGIPIQEDGRAIEPFFGKYLQELSVYEIRKTKTAAYVPYMYVNTIAPIVDPSAPAVKLYRVSFFNFPNYSLLYETMRESASVESWRKVLGIVQAHMLNNPQSADPTRFQQLAEVVTRMAQSESGDGINPYINWTRQEVHQAFGVDIFPPDLEEGEEE